MSDITWRNSSYGNHLLSTDHTLNIYMIQMLISSSFFLFLFPKSFSLFLTVSHSLTLRAHSFKKRRQFLISFVVRRERIKFSRFFWGLFQSQILLPVVSGLIVGTVHYAFVFETITKRWEQLSSDCRWSMTFLALRWVKFSLFGI